MKGIVQNSQAKVVLTDSQYMMVIRANRFNDLLSKLKLTTALDWPTLPNVVTDKIRR